MSARRIWPRTFTARAITAVGASVAAVLSVAGCAGDLEHSTVPVSPAAAVSSTLGSSSPDGAVRWTTVTDPGTGVAVRLAGPAQSAALPVPGAGRLMMHKYVARLANGGEQRLNVTDLAGPVTDLSVVPRMFAGQFGGAVLANTPVTVSGHSGSDFRVRFQGGGRTYVALGRAVYTATHSVQVLTLIAIEHEQQFVGLHEQAVAGLRVP